MDETHSGQSDGRRPMHWVKARLLEFVVGLAAHYIRLIALAPIFAAPTMALMLAGVLTQTSEYFVPFFEWLLPEKLHDEFQGGLMDFGLPIAWEFRALLFWVPIAVGIVEQLSGRRLRHVGLHAKFWLYTLLPVFGLITLYTILFMDINDSRLTGSVIALIMNTFLLGSAMVGVAALMIISLIEKKLVEKLTATEA